MYTQVRGKNISWQHLMQLYHGGLGAKRNAGGLSLLPKLKYEHIYFDFIFKDEGRLSCPGNVHVHYVVFH